MKKFLFLSSAFIMTTLGAHAADKIITNANTCTVDVLGVSDNNATANTIATWSLIDYECGAGQYLLNSDGVLECTECPVGSYCPGGTYTVESDTNGKNTCPADYTSDAGAVGENECYMGCELACTQQTCPEHSENCTHGVSSTTGKQYVNGTCNAEKTFCSIDFECNTGYNKIMANSEFIVANFYFDDAYDSAGSMPYASCELNGADIPNNWHTNVYMSDIQDCDIVTPGVYVDAGENFLLKWQVSYNDHSPENNDVIHKSYTDIDGVEQVFAYSYDVNFTTEVTGNYAWVKPKSITLMNPAAGLIGGFFTGNFTIGGYEWNMIKYLLSAEDYELFKHLVEIGNEEITAEEFKFMFEKVYYELPLDFPWIYLGDATNGEKTNRFATEHLLLKNGYLFGTNDPTKNPLSKFLPNNGAVRCLNNNILINWNPDNGNDMIMSMCKYDGAIALPEDPVKPGYTFTGWKLVE